MEMASIITHTVTTTVTSATSTSTARAPPQGGILEGGNPSRYDSRNPIIIFIIQAGIIIIFCRMLHYPLSRLRQPRVIAEVIGGVLLGPSVMGRIPGFRDAIFPSASIPNLTLAANIGLLLFLFLVGLEVDLRYMLSNWRVALSVSAAGMALPFGLGCAIAYGLYHQFNDEPGTEPVNFGTFTLFIGVAMAITAFPVLCRILTELKLLSTPVGVIVLSAGVGNDVVGWILLALSVALVNSGSGITALWVLLVAIGYTLLVAFAIRPAFHWYLRKSGSLQNGPTQGVMALTILLALASAFFTGVIGIHPIFGAFIIGLICPHEGGFAIKVTEKLEDLVSTLFLPLYFALSGLSTNLGLLDNGITWGYVIAIIAIAFFAKIAGGTLASRLNGLVWRESLTIGCLMSCKGLVELIVLNIGLNARILSTRTFTMFVVMALVTTFATTPLTTWLYPPWYQKKLELWKKGEVDWDGNPILPEDTSSDRDQDNMSQRDAVRRLLIYLRLDALPGIFTFVTLLGGRDGVASAPKSHHTLRKESDIGAEFPDALRHRRNTLEVHGLRLVGLTERESSVMQVSEIQEYANRDPVVKTFRTFGQFNDVAVAGSLAVVPERSYTDTLLSRAADTSSDLIFIPWSETGSMSEQNSLHFPDAGKDLKDLEGPYATFVASLFTSPAPMSSNIAIFVDRGFGGSHGPTRDVQRAVKSLQRMHTGLSIHDDREKATLPNLDHSHHVFVPFFGGADDHFALRFALQLAKNENVTVTVAYFDIEEGPEQTEQLSPSATPAIHTPKKEIPNSIARLTGGKSGNASTHSLSLPRSTTDRSDDSFIFVTARDTLPSDLKERVIFNTHKISTTPFTDIFDLVLTNVKEDVGLNAFSSGDLVIVGRGRVNDHIAGPVDELSKCFGTVGSKILEAGNAIKASLLIVKARDGNGESGSSREGGKGNIIVDIA